MNNMKPRIKLPCLKQVDEKPNSAMSEPSRLSCNHKILLGLPLSEELRASHLP